MARLAFGPDSLTLAERFVGLLHLPYVVGCLLLGALAMGPLTILADYLAYSEIHGTGAGWIPYTSISALGLAGGSVLVGYFLYVPRYMRQRVLDAEQSLAPLLTDGEEGFRKLFDGMSKLQPPLIVLGLFLALNLVPDVLTYSLQLSSFVYLIVTLVSGIGVASVLWTYTVALRGIYRLGKVPLQLAPFYVDTALGLRPVGSLSLSLAKAYFTLVGGAVIVATLLSASVNQLTATVWFSLISILVVLGVVLFFLPLTRLHDRMLECKIREKSKLSEKLAELFRNPADAIAQGDMRQFFILDVIRRDVSSIAVWPFDMDILGRLSVIVLSVVATLISTSIIRLILFPS